MKSILKAIAFGLMLTACQDGEMLIPDTELTEISNWGHDYYARCIAVDGPNVFVGTDNEIYRSINNGDTWTKLPPLSKKSYHNGLRSVHVNNGRLFGGEPSYGFIGSIDNGISWEKITNVISAQEPVYSISSNSNYVYIGTYGSGLFRSNDGGETWEHIFETASIGEPIWNIATEGDNVLIFVYGKGLFHSPDNGNNWTDITRGIDIKFGRGAIHIKDLTIYFGTTKFYKSNDFGNTWIEITTKDNKVDTACIWSIISKGKFLYVSTATGVYYSSDDGGIWDKLPINDKIFGQIFDLAANEDYIFGVDQYNVHRMSRVK